MQLHSADPNILIYVDGHSIKTSNANSRINLDIVGDAYQSGYLEGFGDEARFWFITSFVQLDENQILVVDRQNSCLRSVTLNGRRTQTYTGVCTEAGDLHEGKYGAPNSVIRDNQRPGILLISDERSFGIREFDTARRAGGVFYGNKVMLHGKFWPNVMTQHSISGDLYMTVANMIYSINYRSKQLTYVAGGSSNVFRDGVFHEATFNHPVGILLVNEGKTILVAEYKGRRVRQLELEKKMTSSICHKESAVVGVSANSCGFYYPYSLLANGSELLIGEWGRIGKIRGRYYSRIIAHYLRFLLSCGDFLISYPVHDMHKEKLVASSNFYSIFSCS